MKLNRRQLRKLIESVMINEISEKEINAGFASIGKELVNTINNEINDYLDPEDVDTLDYKIIYNFPEAGGYEINISENDNPDAFNDRVKELIGQLSNKEPNVNIIAATSKEYSDFTLPVKFSMPKYKDTSLEF
tara:strand:- start:328 stop:726 length:399 start_codon:yes stop_codon:yes gene_type:complete